MGSPSKIGVKKSKLAGEIEDRVTGDFIKIMDIMQD